LCNGAARIYINLQFETNWTAVCKDTVESMVSMWDFSDFSISSREYVHKKCISEQKYNTSV
jgi:hypothetical protein